MRVLLDAYAWPLLCGYRGVEYRFLIFNSLQKFLYTRLSNCGPLLVTIDWGISNLHTTYELNNFFIFDGCEGFDFYQFTEIVGGNQ